MNSILSNTLDGDALERVQQTCATRGLDVVAACRRGVMLELTPASLDALPGADALREIADDLGGDGIRYVSLLLEERP